MNSREDAYLAYLGYLERGLFLSLQEDPLAREIAFGTCRRALTLEWMAKQFSAHKLPRKKKERALLFTALYQHYFMDKAPHYALVDETVKLAKKHCHASFASYINALLRRLAPLDLPEDLSIRYSYPRFFIERLCEEYGKERAVQVMEVMNQRAVTMVRIRNGVPEGVKVIADRIGVVEDSALLPQLGKSPAIYIQNGTPAKLIEFLSEGFSPPKRVLDLCASPGGKLLAVHDLYPEAALFANDVSEKKLARLRENLKKYDTEATLTCSLGETYSSEQLFDLIVLDVPCSNSGVLHKRPEARWRLSDKSLKEQAELQKKLLAHAQELLAPGGEIWYLTCSILQEENENSVEEAGMEIRKSQTFLPNEEGWDGGFGCAIGQICPMAI